MSPGFCWNGSVLSPDDQPLHDSRVGTCRVEQPLPVALQEDRESRFLRNSDPRMPGCGPRASGAIPDEGTDGLDRQRRSPGASRSRVAFKDEAVEDGVDEGAIQIENDSLTRSSAMTRRRGSFDGAHSVSARRASRAARRGHGGSRRATPRRSSRGNAGRSHRAAKGRGDHRLGPRRSPSLSCSSASDKSARRA